MAVLAWLESRLDHPTAEQIFHGVRLELPAISFNTIYKTLEVLCQQGLVMKVNPLHEVARYDSRTHPHAHAVCRECQVIMDLDWAPSPEAPMPKELLKGFRIDSQSVIFWGRCPKCQENFVREEE
jgi:Fur family peroxide stress response transcriptional regulator